MFNACTPQGQSILGTGGDKKKRSVYAHNFSTHFLTVMVELRVLQPWPPPPLYRHVFSCGKPREWQPSLRYWNSWIPNKNFSIPATFSKFAMCDANFRCCLHTQQDHGFTPCEGPGPILSMKRKTYHAKDKSVFDGDWGSFRKNVKCTEVFFWDRVRWALPQQDIACTQALKYFGLVHIELYFCFNIQRFACQLFVFFPCGKRNEGAASYLHTPSICIFSVFARDSNLEPLRWDHPLSQTYLVGAPRLSIWPFCRRSIECPVKHSWQEYCRDQNLHF